MKQWDPYVASKNFFYNKCCYFNITGIVILRNIGRVFQAYEKQP